MNPHYDLCQGRQNPDIEPKSHSEQNEEKGKRDAKLARKPRGAGCLTSGQRKLESGLY